MGKAIVDNFGMLQRVRVQKVLLVCSDYDSYTFEEEGLNELVYQWYREHSLSAAVITASRHRSWDPAVQGATTTTW